MNLPPLQIGSLRIPFPVLLAPMAGYTDAAFRLLCREAGAGATCTEVTNADGIVRDSPQTLHLLETVPGERPIGAHLYGANPDSMARAAARVQELGRFDFIDINAGCPVRKIVCKGAGAALLKNPARLEAIVRAVRGAVTLPVTVKTRIGFSPDTLNVIDMVRAVENGGGCAVFIHARFASQQHRGPARWDLLASARAASSIPIVGNGGVDVPAQALDMIRETGVDGVMIGRAAVGHPWIFSQILALAEGRRPDPDPDPEARRALILRHLDSLTALTRLEPRKRRSRFAPETSAALHFRAHIVRYLAGYRGFGEVRRQLDTLTSRERVVEALDRVLRSDPHASTPPAPDSANP